MAGSAHRSLRTGSTALDMSLSPLLRLPGELRNRICEYALTSDDGLKLIWIDGRTSPKLFASGVVGDDIGEEWNQLKYACRELYKETAGLEASLNYVTVQNQRYGPGPPELFGAFIDSCVPNKAAWFTDLNLKHRPQTFLPEHMVKAFLRPIVAFCERNPEVKVRYLPEMFVTVATPMLFMWYGIYLSKVLRGIDLFEELLPNGTATIERVNFWQSLRGQVSSIVAPVTSPNFLFFPGQERNTLDKLWKCLMKSTEHINGKACVPFAEKWCTDGL